MKISLNAIKFLNEHYASAGDPAPDGAQKLAEKIGAQLGAVEEVVEFGKRFDGVLIVQVLQVEDHPDADRLHVCKIDDGGNAQNVDRDENGHVQVVCGAPNVRAGLLAAWLPPGTTVPSTVDKDPFVLEARELRGVISNGMLASPKELTLGDNHEGILEITLDQGTQIAPGTAFADAYHLRGDQIIDMENKMFTHRPDCFGLLGIARELEGIQHRPYKSPAWYRLQPEFPAAEAEELKLEVRNELPELVPRFTAITLRDVQVGPSPIWLLVDLARHGLRSINNIVDYTNWYMLLTGQPLHAYDYDKVMAQDADAGQATLVVRHPKPGEKILLLNGKEIEPRNEAIMIATRDKLIGVGGVMGGGDTEVDENTKNIILECANFDMYSIRRTSMAHGLFTDAVTRFNKGQSPLQNLAVLAKITDEIRKFAAGKVASQLIDDNHLPADMLERSAVHPTVETTTQFINTRLGLRLDAEKMKQLLENVEFKVKLGEISELITRHTQNPTDPFESQLERNDDSTYQKNQELFITAPFWRTDIESPEDIVEEVGRLYGYDHLPLTLPRRDLTPAPKNQLLELKQKIRETLAKAGGNEVLTYSFVHGNLLDQVGQNRDQAFQLGNALSPDLQYYRLSLTPSLLEKIHPNIKAGYDQFALFEIGKAHQQAHADQEGLPAEFERLALVFASNAKVGNARGGAPFYKARKYLMNLLAELGVAGKVSFKPLDLHGDPDSATRYYEPNRAATIYLGDHILGRIGEYKTAVRRTLKLPQDCAGFELGLTPLLQAGWNDRQYVVLPRFPKVQQDICLKVAADLPYQKLYDFVWQALAEVQPPRTFPVLGPVDIYQREAEADHKQITLRLSIASFERTLTDQEVAGLLNQVVERAATALGAEKV